LLSYLLTNIVVSLDGNKLPKQIIRYSPELTVQRQTIRYFPEVTVQQQIIRYFPEVTVQRQIIRYSPELTVQRQIIRYSPELTVQRQIIRYFPEVIVRQQINRYGNVNTTCLMSVGMHTFRARPCSFMQKIVFVCQLLHSWSPVIVGYGKQVVAYVRNILLLLSFMSF
jgi:hypothetical protein